MKSQNQRRRYWIDPKFQAGYLRQILLLELIVMIVTFIMTLGLAFYLMNPDFEAGPGWGGIFAGFLTVLALLAGGLVYLGVRISHRICGPIYRFQKAFDQLNDGQTPLPIHLRHKDELQGLAEAFNQNLAALRSLEPLDPLSNEESTPSGSNPS